MNLERWWFASSRSILLLLLLLLLDGIPRTASYSESEYEIFSLTLRDLFDLGPKRKAVHGAFNCFQTARVGSRA